MQLSEFVVAESEAFYIGAVDSKEENRKYFGTIQIGIC